MPPYREQAIVLRTYKLGEADRILNLLSSGRGKIRAVAKGVRRSGSRFGARLEPYSHVDLQLHTGKSLDVVTQVELIHPFASVRGDFERSACAQVMVEAVDRVATEDERHTRLLLLLLDGLRALDAGPAHPDRVLDGYLLRLASVAGYHPVLRACASCGAPGEHVVFHLAAGGTLCPACAPHGSDPLGEGVLSALRHLADASFDELAVEVDGAGRAHRAAGALINSYVTYHLGAPLKSWELVPR